MKRMTFKELANVKLAHDYGDYKSKEIDKANNLCNEVNQFFPARVLAEVHEEDGNLYYERPVVIIDHPSLVFNITYADYTKKYHIHCESIRDLKNVTHYTREREENKLTKPVNIGKLNKTKIAAWIKYYEDLYHLLAKENEENANKIDAFLKSIEGMDVKWYNNKKSGSIVNNGIEFTFTINETYVSTETKVHYSAPSGLDTFLKLADNKFRPVQEKVN